MNALAPRIRVLVADDSRFLEVLDEQRRGYAATLPGRIAGMDLLWRAVASDRAAPGDLERLTRVAHGLAGSGDAFGFAPLSDAARVLERELHAVADAPTAARKAAVRAAIAAVRRCLGPGA